MVRRVLGIALCLVSPIVLAQSAPQPPQGTNNPYPAPIEATEGVIAVGFTEFVTIPDVTVNNNSVAPRLMMLIDEPGTKRLFVSTMTGTLYSVSYDGKTVTPYLDLN